MKRMTDQDIIFDILESSEIWWFWQQRICGSSFRCWDMARNPIKVQISRNPNFLLKILEVPENPVALTLANGRARIKIQIIIISSSSFSIRSNVMVAEIWPETQWKYRNKEIQKIISLKTLKALGKPVVLTPANSYTLTAVLWFAS